MRGIRRWRRVYNSAWMSQNTEGYMSVCVQMGMCAWCGEVIIRCIKCCVLGRITLASLQYIVPQISSQETYHIKYIKHIRAATLYTAFSFLFAFSHLIDISLEQRQVCGWQNIADIQRHIGEERAWQRKMPYTLKENQASLFIVSVRQKVKIT